MRHAEDGAEGGIFKVEREMDYVAVCDKEGEAIDVRGHVNISLEKGGEGAWGDGYRGICCVA